MRLCHSVCLSVCDSVRSLKKPLTVVKFQNQAHIRNPHGISEVLRPFGAPKAELPKGERKTTEGGRFASGYRNVIQTSRVSSQN